MRPPLKGEHRTVDEAFVAAAEQFADRVAYVEGTRRLSFGEWYRRSDALATVMRRQGIGSGDVVAIMLPPSIDYAIALGAVVLLGGVATGFNTRLGPREISGIVGRCSPRAVVLDEGVVSGDVRHQLGGSIILPRSTIDESSGANGLTGPRSTRSPTDPAVIIWTSGTTGIPKGAWFDHVGLRAAVDSAGVMSAGFDVKLVSTPFAHAGYMGKLWDQLAWVTTSVISPQPWSAADMERLMIDERITVAGGVPTQWAKLLERPGIESADFSRVRVGLVATAPAPPELIERVAQVIGCPLVVRYAMTESPSITGTEPDDPPEVQFRTVGRAQKGMEVAVVGDDGAPVSSGEVGRVRVRGTCVMRGYWNDDESTRAALPGDGWLETSDLGRFDEKGNLVLVGRSNDMYIRGGYNVYPLEVENVLAEHPAVDRAAVVGIPAPVIGEIGVAFVVVRAGSPGPGIDELRSWVTSRLSDYKSPDRVIVVDDLPLTPMMKVDRVELVRRAAG